MLKKSFNLLRARTQTNSIARLPTCAFTTAEGVQTRQAVPDPEVAKLHLKKHSDAMMEPKFFEKEFMPTTEYDLEYFRSPFYELAQTYKVSKDEAEKILEELAVKSAYMKNVETVVEPPTPTKESIAYTRYSDYQPDREGEDMATKYLFEFPRGRQYEFSNSGELFRI